MHKESEECKYGKICERKMCMYKHEEIDDSDDEDSDDEEEEETDEIDDDVTVEKLKPCLEKVQKAIDKVKESLKKVSPNFNCQQCEFEGKNENGLNMHIKAKHPSKQ